MKFNIEVYNMITANSISKSFSSRIVLEDISFTIADNDKVGLIGKNGSGKTTLLNLLRGTIKSDSGAIHRNGEIIGYVAQDIDEYNMPKVAEFEEWRLSYALQQVDLKPDVVTKPLHDLSGGQRARLSIAYVLAQNPTPTVLLLDEPTNNLDKEGMDWLKAFISSFQEKIVVVTHDRAFINEFAEKLWILEHGKLREFKGNYDDYNLFQKEEQEQEAREYKNHRQEQKKVERLIRDATDRSRGDSSSRKARDNDKFVKNFKNEYVQNSFGRRAKALQTRLEKLGAVKTLRVEKKYRVTLSGEARGTKLLLELDHITKKYRNLIAINELSLTIFGPNRLWVKGRNGSGKSTLLKICAQIIEPTSGTVRYGEGVRVGYFSQDVYGLDMLKSGYELLSRLYVEDEKIYKTAKSMGLSIDSLHQKVGKLSRGQQAKVGFLKLLLVKYDLLILDEPTNHLDIATKESIEHALDMYTGALIVASHDEYFINRLSINREVALSE
jgi:ATPase subunit of ABC transporter with duplicated ATPase domains